MKRLILALTPQWILRVYHYCFAKIAAWWYGYPSQRMIVIGVTGTNGKSTTVMMIGRICEVAGYKVGWTSTATISIAGREWLNTSKMTMLGRFHLQKLLRQMVDAGCEIAIVETSSQGLMQYRHFGIDYDIAVFTNLTPEHIEAHGGFEHYKQAKGELFRSLKRGTTRLKTLRGRAIPKMIVANIDDPHAPYYLSFPADERIGLSVEDGDVSRAVRESLQYILTARMVSITGDGSQFEVDGCPFSLHVLGRHNIYNAMAAIAATRPLAIPFATANDALEALKSLPGRVEWIDEGQSFKVMVDYAPEPEGLRQLYETLNLVSYRRLIHVLGSCGGGRDVARRSILGRMAAEKADVVIITNEDPYDDDPQQIIDDIVVGVKSASETLQREHHHPWMKKNGGALELYTFLDRRAAIEKAVTLAQPNDLVLVTGKGSEQAMCLAGGKKTPWDDRIVLRECIRACQKNNS